MLNTESLNESENWDEIVRSFSEYDIYYLSGYVKAFHFHGDGEPLLFYYEGKDIRGINVVMKRDVALDEHFKDKIPVNMYFDFSTPYGYGGWVTEGSGATEELFKTYKNWCMKNNIISEFVRYHPVINNFHISQDAYEAIEHGNTIAIDLSSPEGIWENFTSQNRNKIRKALKAGIKIYNGRYPEIFSEFQEIYNKTMDKDNATDYYYFKNEFYQSVMNDLKYGSQIFYAVYDNKLIAVSIVLGANGFLSYHLSGSLKEYQNYAPTNLLLYEVAMWGNMNGFKTLHLGGGVGGSAKDSLYQFKKGFYRKEPCKFYIGKKIFNQGKYDYLLNLRKSLDNNFDVNTGFFPKYRG